VATGIAAAVAGSGYRAVVLDASSDADLTLALDLGDRRGLGDVVAENGAGLERSLVTGPAGIEILPRGGSDAVELISVDRAREILDSLLRVANLVVIDGGALQRSAGALSWARAAHQTVVVVRRGSSRREDLRLGLESLRFVNATIGGAVLVQRSPGRSFRRPLRSRQRGRHSTVGGSPRSAPVGTKSSAASVVTRPTVTAAPVDPGSYAPQPSAPTRMRTAGQTRQDRETAGAEASTDGGPPRDSVTDVPTSDDDRMPRKATSRTRPAD
jgi:hypothetical protein